MKRAALKIFAILILAGYGAYLFGLLTVTRYPIDGALFPLLTRLIWIGPWLALIPLALILIFSRKRDLAAVLEQSAGLEIFTVMVTGAALCMCIPVITSEVSDFYLLGVLIAYAGLIFLAFQSISNKRLVQAMVRMTLLAFGLSLALPIAEIAIRARSDDLQYTVIRPNLDVIRHPDEDALPGLSGPSRFTTDSLGIRGDAYSDEGRFHILAIGGSTTEALYLDDSEAWPYLVQESLNSAVWVGNIGRSGHRLVNHIHALRHFVPQIRVDAVILMVGINDLLAFLRDPAGYEIDDPDIFSPSFENSFFTRPFVDADIQRPFPQSLGIYQMGRYTRYFDSFLTSGGEIFIEDAAGSHYHLRREALQSAPLVIDELPDLTPLLAVYERNLRAAIDTASGQGIRLILVTQPSIYSDSMSESAQDLLWMAYAGDLNKPQARYTPPVLAEGMHLLNQRLLEVCSARAVDCLNLASTMDGDERFFYDDVHFNEAGSRHAAEQISAFLASVVLP